MFQYSAAECGRTRMDTDYGLIFIQILHGGSQISSEKRKYLVQTEIVSSVLLGPARRRFPLGIIPELPFGNWTENNSLIASR